MQRKESIKPLFIDTDTAFEELKPFQSPFIKGLSFDINANPVSVLGTGNPTGEGQNQLVQTTVRSNTAVPNVLLPAGYNKHIGCFESITTQELYSFEYNINGNHGIYVLSGNTGVWQRVIIDPNLLFTDTQENYIANHRVSLRFVKDKDNNIIEKYLLITEGNTWQKYINVIAAISTNGFDATAYPYWNLKQPHFDRRELVEWPVRPPMIMPVATPLPNTDADKGKLNRFIDKGFQIAIAFQNTDGRQSLLSPYSLPILIKSEDFLNNPDNIPKNVKVTMPAGSPLTEKILFYIRKAKLGENTLPSIQNWTDWYLYDTIKKFPDSNTGNVIGSQYWLRTNPFAGMNYDVVFNTVDYVFDLSKVQQIVPDQELANSIQTEMPQLSVAMTDLGDNLLLGDNRYGYPNFGDEIIDALSIEVAEKESSSCPVALRKIRLYAYIGRCGDDFTYQSQVGYYIGEDKTMRFGGLFAGGSNSIVYAEVDEAKSFDLNFADKDAFRCYLKGTPYYADGTWYYVNSDNSLVKFGALLDINEEAVKEQLQAILNDGGYFICVFDVEAPAGRYIATLGRHNVASAGDYRNTSTYIYGIANSRIKSQTITDTNQFVTSIKPNAIVPGSGVIYSKEMEIDCTAGNVDVWGNNQDLFYVYCPYITRQGNLHYRFIEGYLYEDHIDDSVGNPVEMFPYNMIHHANDQRSFDDWGRFTDKNGHYWGYTKIDNANIADTFFTVKLNCAYPFTFRIPTSQSGSGWKVNMNAYVADFNGGTFGVVNRILYFIEVTSLDGTLRYSNIAVSIKDGATVYTNQDGEATMVVHNGMSTPRVSNVYVNAGSNFSISIAACGQVPLFNFNDALAPCILPLPSGGVRSYPIDLKLGVYISSSSQTSLKESVKYNVAVYGADLAGRVMYANVISEPTVQSFLQRDNINATFFRLNVAAGIDFTAYEDMKWLFVAVSKNVSIKRYIQWVGDEIDYIDNSGNTVSDPASAVFVSIKINSLYNSNLSQNFSLLSKYQFVKEDRVRILDDGQGNLFDVATYGDPIDLQILGTNYEQAAIDSGLLPPQSNTVLSTTPTSPDVSLIVKYDSRLDRVRDKSGFWIEIYTPTEQSDIIPFYEVKSFPIINGKPAIFTGFDNNGQPKYTYITTFDLEFWDTYFFDRSITIPDVGNKNFGHPFESPNVTDNWGADIISGGRNNIKNDNAKQFWLGGETIKSDNFLKEGLLNGLATFRSGNKKDFGTYPFGAITAMHSERNIIAFICENDWFITDYNYHYAYVNEQGVMVANLDDGLSTPHQKIGSQFGMKKEDTATLIPYDKEIYWYDRKNTGWIRMNYRDAVDITSKSQVEQGGMESFLNAKTDFITTWNNLHDKENSFDVVSGIDVQLGKIYVTFRCRRNNSNDISSYINDRRNWQLNYQETVVYDTINHGWLRSEGFTPEGYGSLRGNATGIQLISFAAGKPYYHSSEKTSFNKFYGVQTTPIIIGVFNTQNDAQKVLEAIIIGGVPSGWFIDMIYTNFYNSFSYLSVNKFQQLYRNYYAAVQTNANSYPSNQPEELFRSMFNDGYRIVGKYIVFRMVADYQHLNEYKEVGIINGILTGDPSNKKVVQAQ